MIFRMSFPVLGMVHSLPWFDARRASVFGVLPGNDDKERLN